MLEISDAVFVENDARDRQASGGISRTWWDWSLAEGKRWKHKEQHGYFQRMHRSSVNEGSRATQREGWRQKTSSASQIDRRSTTRPYEVLDTADRVSGAVDSVSEF